MKKLDFSFELGAMGYMFSFPPSFSKRFNYTFNMIFDNPLFTRIGAGINALLLIENEFDIYNKIKNYFLKENISPNLNENNDEYNNIETREGFNTEAINTSDSWHCQSSTHEYNVGVL